MTEGGFASFFREQFSRVVFLLIKLGASQADAEDAAQETMVEAWKKWDTIDNPAAWVCAVAVWKYRKLLSRRPVTVSLPESVPETTVASDLSILAEGQQHVLSVFRRLPLMQRLVLSLIYDGFSCKEIAELLGITAATVRSHLRHARNNVKEMMLSAWLPGLEAPQGRVSTVTSCEDPEFAALDAYIRSQLAGAAEIYSSRIDVDARLKAVLEAAKEDTHDDAAAADD